MKKGIIKTGIKANVISKDELIVEIIKPTQIVKNY